MQERKITIVSTKNQRKNIIMSAATTLYELKKDLRANGIDFTDMTFFEGISKIELKKDDSVLPHDIPYKGTITNELVFMLTNTNKKIKSGAMSRIEVYNTIKSMGLQDACVKKFGKNFTMCKTADLITLIESNCNKSNSTNNKGETVEASEKNSSNENQCIDMVARTTINKLINTLMYYELIDNNDAEEILNTLGKVSDNSNSPYSDEEIDKMFDFI